MDIRKLYLGLVALMAVMFSVVTASAGTVYSTLGPNGEFDIYGGYDVSGSNFFNEVIANPFTTTTTATLTYAMLGLANVQGTNNSPVSVFVETDNGGVPGSIIATLTQMGSIPAVIGGLVTFTCATCPVLQAGTQYWLVAQETDPDSDQIWNYAFNDQSGSGAYNLIGSATGPWNLFSAAATAFEIDGSTTTPVPEPGSFVLLGSGLLELAGIARRRHKF